jgi:tRNA A-37 threonylcarbamoyl transferase component Bud32
MPVDAFFDLLQEACRQQEPHAAGWHIRQKEGASGVWLYVTPEGASPPEQGWKLHVSADLFSAEQVLRRALPVLLAERAPFKVATSLEILATLNDGRSGLSQVGKFVTVYPKDTAHAVRLASRLDEATRGLLGPTIPSDRPLKPGSRVFYRYGSFGGRHMQVPLGEVVSLLETPEGRLVPDRRGTSYWAPEWVGEDPFIAAGVAQEPPKPTRVIAGRYATAATLHQSSRSTLYLAIDLPRVRKCVLKRVSKAAAPAEASHHRLRHELEVLTLLAPSPWFPAPYEFFEDGDDLYLAMEDIEGETLEAHIRSLAAQGRGVSQAQLVSWGLQLTQALGQLHARGLVYGDLKSNNILLPPGGHLRLVDLELAHPASAPRRQGAGMGTRGYMSPSQAAGQPLTFTDDVYSLGAVLFFMASAAEPSNSPSGPLLSRPLSLLRPSLAPALEAVIARCLELEPERRFGSLREVATALEALGTGSPRAPAAPRREAGPGPDFYRAQARRLGDTLVHVAQREPDVGAVFWLDGHARSSSFPSRDLNTGSAGVLVALSALVATFDAPSHRAALAEGARWLDTSPRPEGPLHPGLYVGEAGVGLALLRASQVLKEEALLQAALERGRRVASLPFDSPDLFNGTAGRLRFHLWLWQATASVESLQAAIAAGEALLQGAQRTKEEGLQWSIPPGYDGLSGISHLGYAHGAAGIADTLLDLYEATGEERFLSAARSAGRWLATQALPALEDGSGSAWPSVADKPPNPAFWCHGAAGMAKFFLHAARLEVLPEARSLAERGAWATARGSRWSNPVQCHGLSGNIELLVDMYQYTRESFWLDEARELARLLQAYAVERQGHLYWPSEAPTVFSPAYMVGYSGVAACFLRLAEPERLPGLLDWVPTRPVRAG